MLWEPRKSLRCERAQGYALRGVSRSSANRNCRAKRSTSAGSGLPNLSSSSATRAASAACLFVRLSSSTLARYLQLNDRQWCRRDDPGPRPPSRLRCERPTTGRVQSPPAAGEPVVDSRDRGLRHREPVRRRGRPGCRRGSLLASPDYNTFDPIRSGPLFNGKETRQGALLEGICDAARRYTCKEGRPSLFRLVTELSRD